MAVPVQLVAESAGEMGNNFFVRLKIVQGDEELGKALIHYRNDQMRASSDDPTPGELRAETLNDLLIHFNEQLKEWCS